MTEAVDSRSVVLAGMAAQVRKVNEDNGWFDESRTIGDGMALLMSEGAEAFDAWRKWGFDDHIEEGTGKPLGYGSELADVLIRLLDQCDRDGVDLGAEFDRKLEYNRTRGYRHGGRRV